MQRQTVISQFYQNDRLVVEAGLSVSFSGSRLERMGRRADMVQGKDKEGKGSIVRQKDPG